MHQQLQEQVKLQEKLLRAKQKESFLCTRLEQQAHLIKQGSYALRILEFSTILLSWYVGEPYAAGVLAGGITAIVAFTCQLGRATENAESTQKQISNTQQYMNVLKTLQIACGDQWLRQALQARGTSKSSSYQHIQAMS